MAPNALHQLSHAIETIVAAAMYPLTALLALALVLLAVDAAREHFAKRRASARAAAATRPRWSDESRHVPRRTLGQPE